MTQIKRPPIFKTYKRTDRLCDWCGQVKKTWMFELLRRADNHSEIFRLCRKCVQTVDREI